MDFKTKRNLGKKYTVRVGIYIMIHFSFMKALKKIASILYMDWPSREQFQICPYIAYFTSSGHVPEKRDSVGLGLYSMKMDLIA